MVDIDFPPTNANGPLSYIRRTIVHTMLNEEDPQNIVHRACRTISVSLGCSCSFTEQSVTPSELPGFISICVNSYKMFTGTFVIEDIVLNPKVGLDMSNVQELAELVGLCAMQSIQAKEMTELQDDSEAMLFHAPDAIFVVDQHGIINMANWRALELVEKTEKQVEGHTLKSVFGPKTPPVKELGRLASNNLKFEIEVLGDHGRRLVSFTVSEVEGGDTGKMLCVGRDITAERQAELALRKNDRSSLMAQTVNYLLHEVNNPLAALMSNISFAARRNKKLTQTITLLNNNDYSKETTKQINATIKDMNESLEGAERAGDRITSAMEMLRTANQQRSKANVTKVEALFELELATSGLKQDFKDVEIESDIESLPMLKAPPLHLAEVFGALLKNSAEAISAIDDGKIWVSTRASKTDVKITVEDNGEGVHPAHCEQIFMPFFTTKSLDNNIGLGLTMAADMVRRIGGKIHMETPKNGGARFIVSLPV